MEGMTGSMVIGKTGLTHIPNLPSRLPTMLPLADIITDPDSDDLVLKDWGTETVATGCVS